MIESDQADPATIVADRASLRLAVIAAMQHLPPRQRAVLILRDVLPGGRPRSPRSWTPPPSRSTAPCSGPGRSSTRSAPGRGPDHRTDRCGAARTARPVRGGVREEGHPGDRRAVHQGRVWEMPPFTGWYQGAAEHRAPDRHPVPGRGPRRHAPDPDQRQRAARVRAVHARRGRLVPAVQPAGPHHRRRTGSPTSPASSTCACSRRSGCRHPFRRPSRRSPAPTN